MAYLSVDPDLSRLRLRQDSYFEQFSPWRGCTVQGMMANGDEHHHFLHRPLLDQIASVDTAWPCWAAGEWIGSRAK